MAGCLWIILTFDTKYTFINYKTVLILRWDVHNIIITFIIYICIIHISGLMN